MLNEDLLMEAVKNAKDTTYLTHNYHPFPAKFIPHLPQILIKDFSKAGDTVLDPFSGSGTTLVEATLLGRHCIGTDINPISVLASKVKTTALGKDEIKLIETCLLVLEEADTMADYSKHIPEFHGRDHWFMAHVQNELAMLRSTITDLTKPDSSARNFLDLAFSGIVNLVSNQDSDTRYAAVEKKIPVGKPTQLMIQRTKMMLERMNEYATRAQDVTADARLADSRQLGFIKDACIDLVVTSPPYANTYDYYLYHKHRMNWLGLNWKGAMDDEIGSRNKHSSKKEEIDLYISDMRQSFVHFARILKPGAYAIFIIGDSVIRDVLYKADDIVRNIAEPLGFEWIDCVTYDLGLASKMFSRAFRRSEKEEHIVLLRREGLSPKHLEHRLIRHRSQPPVGGQMNIRIYTESLEQGQAFFLPIIKKTFPKHTVTLARIPTASNVKKNRLLKGVFDLANPDGLATIVDEHGNEFPFATFEISDAVKTEDHELQRFPQVCSAMSYDLIFIKISPHHKQTRALFGGNINFNPLVIPTTLRDVYKFNGAYLLDWPNGANDFVCKRNPDAPSCPETGCIDMLEPVLSAISTTLQKGILPKEGTYTFSDEVWANLEMKTKKKYTTILNGAPRQADLFKEWAKQAIPVDKGYLRKRMVSKSELLVTVPRFDRDSPGPGEVMGYAMISNAKKVGIAYCGRDRGMRIDSKAEKRRLNLPCRSIDDVMNRFFDIFDQGKDKMPVALLQVLQKAWKANKSARIDITNELATLAVKNGKMAKWVLTFIFFADYLKIHDRPDINHPVTFHWNRQKIIGSQYNSSNPMENLRSFNPVTAPPATPLRDPSDGIAHCGGEDYVTWAASQILSQSPFNWNFVALSYPGSQGDGAILPSGSHGLNRKRTYCDGLAVKKNQGLILEAKHKEGQIQPDVTKLKKLIEHEQAAMKDAFDRMGKKVQSFSTCVAFSVSDNGLSSSPQRRKELSGVDLAVTFSDTSGDYQVVEIKSGKILKQGKLLTHDMHSIA